MTECRECIEGHPNTVWICLNQNCKARGKQEGEMVETCPECGSNNILQPCPIKKGGPPEGIPKVY